MPQADEHLARAYADLGLTDALAAERFARIYEIRDHLGIQNSLTPIPANTTGTISERLCELALRSAVPEAYFRTPQFWRWMADFYVLGAPFNTLISVKSFKAKERLLVSGSGNLLSPTVGFGLFDDPSEFTARRLKQYAFRAFVAIYAPRDRVIEQLSPPARAVLNINSRPLMRPLEDFVDDLRAASTGQGAGARLDPNRF